MIITDKVIASAIKDIVILTDSREQKNKHILEYFNDKEIPHRIEKLDTADYTFILPNYSMLNLDRSVLVEKKNSLDEIANNFTKDRVRFVAEFERIEKEKIHLLIENASWKKVVSGSYRSKIPPQSMLASLLTWNMRYSCPIWFSSPAESGMLIYNIIKYELMEELKRKRLDK